LRQRSLKVVAGKIKPTNRAVRGELSFEGCDGQGDEFFWGERFVVRFFISILDIIVFIL